MSFAEVVFPTEISYGCKGRPRFSTSIIGLPSGAEERTARWGYPLFSYNARKAITSDDKLRLVQDFIIKRLGPFEGFLWEDKLNRSTDPERTTVAANPSFDDVLLGVGDGVQTVFQAAMKYEDVVTRTKNIYKIIPGTAHVGWGGVEKTQGVDWTINNTTGEITIDSSALASTSGLDVTWGGNHYIPARFGQEFDDDAVISLDEFKSGGVPDIPVVEIEIPGITVDVYWNGGSSEIAFGADISITPNNGRVLIMNPAADNKKVALPNTTNLEDGGPYFICKNIHASNNIIFTDKDGNTRFTLAGTKGAHIFLSTEASVKTWRGYISN